MSWNALTIGLAVAVVSGAGIPLAAALDLAGTGGLDDSELSPATSVAGSGGDDSLAQVKGMLGLDRAGPLGGLMAMLGLGGGPNAGSAKANLMLDGRDADGRGLSLGESLDSDGMSDDGKDFRVHNTLAPTVTTEDGSLGLTNAVEVTDQQAHVNTHVVGTHEDDRLGDFTGLDVYYDDLTSPEVQAHKTVNVDANGTHQALDQHLVVPGN